MSGRCPRNSQTAQQPFPISGVVSIDEKVDGVLGPFAVSITEENAGPHLRGETHTHAPGLPVAVSPTHSNLRESSPRSAPFAGHAARGILPFLHPRVVTSTVEYSDYARLLCPLLIESVAIGPFKPAYSLKVCTYIHTASFACTQH